MNKERKIDPEKIHIIDIKTLKGRIHGDSDALNINGYRFRTDMAVALNLDEKIIGMKLTLYIDTLDKNQIKLDIEASYTHEFIFRIENLEDFVDVKQEEQKDDIIDPLLIGTVAGIAYSTIRGIIITRTQGTPLNAVILPVIDPKKIMGLTVEERK